MGEYALGQPVTRFEDPRLLRGGGRYVDDIALPNMAFGVVLRARHAHARILKLDTSRAKAAPGVLAVLTHADWAASGYDDFPRPTGRKKRDGAPMYRPVDQRARLLEGLEHGDQFTINLLAEDQTADSNHFAGRPVPDYHPLRPDLSLEGALATLHCRRWQVYPGGDHRIVVGLVENLQLGSEAQPLLYWNRGYRRIS